MFNMGLGFDAYIVSSAALADTIIKDFKQNMNYGYDSDSALEMALKGVDQEALTTSDVNRINREITNYARLRS
jgi:hypothetical protein